MTGPQRPGPQCPGPQCPGPQRIDAETVEALYHQHAPALRRFLLGLLRNDAWADEALQATFLTLIEKGETLIEKGHATEESARKAWMFRVAHNRAMLIHRRRKLDRKAQPTIFELARRRASSRNDESLEEAEQQQLVRRAIDQLPDAQRTVVLQRIDYERTFAEIAANENVPLGTVLTRMRLALDKLRTTLGDETNRSW